MVRWHRVFAWFEWVNADSQCKTSSIMIWRVHFCCMAMSMTMRTHTWTHISIANVESKCNWLYTFYNFISFEEPSPRHLHDTQATSILHWFSALTWRTGCHFSRGSSDARFLPSNGTFWARIGCFLEGFPSLLPWSCTTIFDGGFAGVLPLPF